MKQPQIPVSELPPPPYKPGPGIDNICPFNPSKCPPKPPAKKDDDDDKGHGPLVIFAPPVTIPVPVGVPATAPIRLATAPASTARAPAKPVANSSSANSSSVASSQCGTNGTIPALAAGIDELLPTAQLSKDDIAKVTELRKTIQDLATVGKVAAARNVEEVAMYYLGYQKLWLQCGAGTFAWQQIVYNDAVQSADQSK